MLTFRPRIRSLRAAALALLAVGALATSCSLVGQGHLNVANDLSGLGADNTTLRAYAPGSGDVWPPAGFVNLWVKGDSFGAPPSYGMNGYLYLVRTSKPCPMSEGRPETFVLSDVTITGIVTVTNGSVNQFLTMQDTPANRAARWALIDIPVLAGYPGEHFVRRCGDVTWTGGTATIVDPCTLRTAVDGSALSDGRTFALDASRKWQFCYGGAAAGSNEKLLFRTLDGGVTWTLISRTTLGSPPPEAGVGVLPNGNGVSALFFQDAAKGWLGLSSPGANLYRSSDGGVTWANVAVADLPAATPVTAITFTDATHGSFTTPVGTWTTSDGGTTWTKSP